MRAFLVLAALLFLLPSACSPLVGDACTASADCGRTMFCERSLPGGYCTLESCDNRTCPDDGVCIRFTEDISWCMQPCEVNGDCRSGYTCVEGFGAYAFCDDSRGTVPGETP